MDLAKPPSFLQSTVSVLRNEAIARDTYRLRVEAPEIAKAIRPGQFVMVRPESGTDPLLGRPFALYDVIRDASGAPYAIDIVYLVVGKGTAALASRRTSDQLTIWGPLGNGFGDPPQGSSVFIAGGIGQTPFLTLAKWWSGQQEYGGVRFPVQSIDLMRMFYGVRNADLLAGIDDFRDLGLDLRIATDDGSAGSRGFVTNLFAESLKTEGPPAKVIGCGPSPMLGALAKIAEEHAIDCDLSLENHMACGFGVCFSCVAPIRQEDGSIDLRRVCVEGPIFPSRSVVMSG